MPWTLEIWNPTRTQRLRTLSSDTATELDGGFRWQLDQYGDCRQWEATGRNDRLGIPPRAVVKFFVDGAPWFHGVIVDPPSVTSPDAEALTALGGREILGAALMDGAVYRNQGVYQIARDVLGRLCPPALIYDATQIGNGSGTDAGPGLDTFYSPTATLADVMDALAKSAGVPWGVDTLGRPFLGRPAAAPLVVPYAGQPWRRLTVQGREACTQAVLRAVSAPSGDPPYSRSIWADGFYLPATLTTQATHAAHPTYRASRGITPPEGVGLVRPDGGIGHETIGPVQSPEAAFDGADTTAARMVSNAGEFSQILTRSAPVQRVVGFRIVYALSIDHGGDLQFSVDLTYDNPDGSRNLSATWSLPHGPKRDMTVIMPPHAALPAAGTHSTTLSVYAGGAVPAGAFDVFTLALLVVDEDAAQRVAESYLQVPFSTPAELTLPGLIPPSPSVTVTGSPDGDVSGPAGLFMYTLTAAGGRQTLVRLGTTGQDQTVRALRWAVRQ